MTLPRLLVIMGSGETSPTMVTPHQRVLSRLGADAPAVVLDTPFGFQENADELTDRITTYFRESVGREVRPLAARSRDDSTAMAHALAGLHDARWVFAGPGSPSYALRNWSGTGIVDALDERLRTGGAVVFASAAALTLGEFTVPVYEIYKVGDDPAWLHGLDVLGRATGIRAAVVPHFDNAEGGTHDTRFCYLGERRLRLLVDELPAGACVIGIDEHTGIVIDLEAESVEVIGRGSLTIVTHGGWTEFASGETVALDAIRSLAGDVARRPAAVVPTAGDDRAAAARQALADGDVPGAVAGILAEQASPGADPDTVRALIVALGTYAADAPTDAAIVPFVELALDLRAAARAEKRFADSDLIRDRLADLGIEVRDTPEGQAWERV